MARKRPPVRTLVESVEEADRFIDRRRPFVFPTHEDVSGIGKPLSPFITVEPTDYVAFAHRYGGEEGARVEMKRLVREKFVAPRPATEAIRSE